MEVFGKILSDLMSTMFAMNPDTTSGITSAITGFFGFFATIGNMFQTLFGYFS